MVFIWMLLVMFVNEAVCQVTQGQENVLQCDCMEYWDCTLKGGQPLGYCDPSETKMCCFLPKTPKRVSLLSLTRAKAAGCGRKGQSSGKEGVAELGEWPWHVAILGKKQNLYVCGGSLLDEHWVLTAAHCVDDYVTSDLLKVRLGEYDVGFESQGLPYEEFSVSKIVIHPEFSNASLINDVALLKLENRAKKKPHIDIVCLPPEFKNSDMDVNRKCFVTGWGRRNESTSHALVLKEIPVPLWTPESCEASLRQQFGPEFVLTPTTLCAGTDSMDACDGDGGGPLVCELEGLWYQVGIVSFGLGCGRPGIPGVYTFVPSFIDWIMGTIRQFGRQ